MISVYQLKAWFQDRLRPVCARLAAAGVTANQVTLAACVLSLIYGAALCLDQPALWFALPALLLARMALNAIDGMLAREHDMRSKLGMALNETGDVLSDLALYAPFALVAPDAALAVVGFMIAAVMTEFCGLLAFMIGGARRYDGPMGKSDRAVAIGVLGVLIGAGVASPPLLTAVFAALALLCVWTAVNRVRSVLGA